MGEDIISHTVDTQRILDLSNLLPVPKLMLSL